MIDIQDMLLRARRDAAEGHVEEALLQVSHALELSESQQDRFESLLLRAQLEGGELGAPTKALDTYWEARHLTRSHHLGRAGEADLGIGMMLIDLDRTNEGLEAIRRASRYFRKSGNTYLRACAETILADVAICRGEDTMAERHLEIATDLLMANNDGRMLSSVLTLRAGVLGRNGRKRQAEQLLAEARRQAGDLHDPDVEAELQGLRTAVRQSIAIAAGDEL
ncbi:MAG: hypothetical protein AAF533_19525 [Acidobacteriota bacterium]